MNRTIQLRCKGLALGIIPAIAMLFLPAVVSAQCASGKVFRGGVSTNGGMDFVPSVGAAENVFIGGTLCPQSAHVGRLADVIVAVSSGGQLSILDSSLQLQPFNPEQVPAFQEAVILSQSMPLELYQGAAGAALGAVDIFVGYRIDGEYFYDQMAAGFSVNAGSSLHALQFTPQPRSITAGKSQITVAFDRPVDPGTVGADDLKVFGRWTGVIQGETSLSTDGQNLVFDIRSSLSAGEWLSATLPAGSIRAADGSELTRGYSWSQWITAGTSDLNFEQIQEISTREAGSQQQIQTYGAYAGDLNGDGWSDFVVPNEISNDLRIFLNDGAGNYGDFSIVPIEEANRPSPNEGADLDGDGDIDFVVGSAWGNHVHVFMGDGAGNLVQTQNLVAGSRVRGVCLLDFENDGDADVFATTYIGNRVALFTNDGNGTFSSATTFDVANGEWSCASVDLNEDGLTDIVVGSRISNELVALISNGDGSFTESSRSAAAGDPWMLTAGDMNGDGHGDVVAVNSQQKTMTVTLGDGLGGLESTASYSVAENGEGFPLAVDVGDLDGDGDLDVVTADFTTRLFLIFENLGDGTMVRKPKQLIAPAAASCAVLHDRDNDGDLDITGIDEVDDKLLLFRN
ncbi:MAG: FG-GAP-like repeat-containing protein [Proteobacteria bacterium]|nr:FG-GAP-like repeat-containing protein [Pseudomonadota bacterium]MDA0927521.1 FG-GAP-like repeat-containing protein [Pseudomonadota bacterium]